MLYRYVVSCQSIPQCGQEIVRKYQRNQTFLLSVISFVTLVIYLCAIWMYLTCVEVNKSWS